MKRKFKILTAIMAVTALGVTAAGCSAKDKTDKFFEQLFCEHKYDEGVETQAPTCSEEGVFTYTCTECGKTKKEDIPTIDHTEAEMPSMSPTCTEAGYAGGVWCEVCEFVIVEQTELAALGHFEVKDLAIAATCVQSGKTEGSHCARCHEVILAQEKTSATGHKIVTVAGKPATCTETGLTDGQACENCGTVFVAQETIPATGHMDSNDNSVCDVCGFVLDYIFDDSAVYTERAVSSNETVSGKWFRFYYDVDLRLDMFFENGFDVDFLEGVGIMVYADASSVVIMGLKGGVTTDLANQIEYVHNAEGEYVDFFIPSNYVLTYSGTNQVQFTSETSFSSVSQIDKLFVLEVN